MSRRKLIEVALPLQAINAESAKEKSIRHGHPSTLHLWWARRPLATCRAVIFAQMVDDPADPEAPALYLRELDRLKRTLRIERAHRHDDTVDERRRWLFDFIGELVRWDRSNDRTLLDGAHALIRACAPKPELLPATGEFDGRAVEFPTWMITDAGFTDERRAWEEGWLEAREVFDREGVWPGTTEDQCRWLIRVNRELHWDVLEPAAARPYVDSLYEAIRAGWEDLPGFPPAFADPFSGGGSFPLEAQRLGLESHGSDLNPVAVLVGKAMIEIPGPFAGLPPVNPDAQHALAASRPNTKGKKGKKTTQSVLTGDDEDEIAAFAPGDSPFVGLAADVRAYGAWMRAEVERSFAHLNDGQGLYPKVAAYHDPKTGRWYGEDEVCMQGGEAFPCDPADDLLDPLTRYELTAVAWLWARTIPSPNPALGGAPVPLVRSFILSAKSKNRVWIEPIVNSQARTVDFRVQEERFAPENSKAPEGTIGKRGGRCLISGVPMTFKHVRAEAKLGHMGQQLMAVVCEAPEGHAKGRVFLPPSKAQAMAAVAHPTWRPNTALPDEALGFRVQGYGMGQWSDLFTDRQTLTLACFADLVPKVHERVLVDAQAANHKNAVGYANAVATYCGFGVSKMTDLNNGLCRWGSTDLRVRNLFSRQAISMNWDFAETSPLNYAAGGFEFGLSYLVKALLGLPLGSGNIKQCPAQEALCHTPGRLISTDPPYYDNVPYADLSEFFYVWLRRALRDVYPNLLTGPGVPKAEELVADRFRHGSESVARRFFEQGMREVFRNLRSCAPEGYPSTVVYAFKQQEDDEQASDDDRGLFQGSEGAGSTGWETLLQALVDEGLAVTATWPMRTELGNRMRAQGSNALASSVVLACRVRPEDAPRIDKATLRRTLDRELPSALRDVVSGGLPPVDLFQAAVGLGMAVYSRYSSVEGADGRPVRVGEALKLIDESVKRALEEGEEEMDDATRWAVRWFATYGYEERAYGYAEGMAVASNLPVKRVEDAGILKADDGKVWLIRPDLLRDDDDPAKDANPTLWEATLFLARRLERDGEASAAQLLRRYRDARPAVPIDSARDLAYRLFVLADRGGRGADGKIFDSLARTWSRIDLLADADQAQWHVTEGGGQGLLL